MGNTFCEVDTASKSIKNFRGRHACHLNHVSLFNAITRMSQVIGKITIVGQKNKSFAHAIKSTDGKQSMINWNKIKYTWSSRRIKISRYHTDRLVKHVNNTFGIGKTFSIDSNLLFVRINASSKFSNHTTIYLDSPCGNQGFTVATTSEPR
jgi:hypothetical protein